MTRRDAERKAQRGDKMHAYMIYTILALILANAAFYALTHIEGSSNYGDDTNYLWLASSVVHGNFQIIPGYIFSVRLMSFLPIAFFYLLLGITNFSSTLWNIISYLGIIAVTFLAVRFFYDDRSALISAFLASVFPIITQNAVNISEDVPLTFITSLAVLLFLYAEKSKSRRQFFASGALLVVSWLISYEATIVIAFVLLYALVQVLRKKIKIGGSSLFFLYGIAAAFLLTFVFSYINAGMPFVTITTNFRFYSGIGQRVNGLPTIPTANEDLGFYIRSMYEYGILDSLRHGGPILAAQNLWKELFANINNSFYGLFFYLFIPAAAALLVTDRKRSYFMFCWFAFTWLFLEFGPMSVSINLSPFSITYLLAHRLERFLMILSVPLCAIIGVALSKLIGSKKVYLLVPGAVLLVFTLAILYANNYVISTFWYYWQYYPESITLEMANYLRPFVYTSSIYVDAISPGGGVSFYGANMPAYLGYPSDPRYFLMYANASCSQFSNSSYVVWIGNPGCGDRLTNVFNVTTPTNIPDYIIRSETPNLFGIPTNIYYAR